MQEQWERWTPAEGLAEDYHLEAMQSDLKELIICLATTKQLVKVIFKNSVVAYNTTEEHFRLTTFGYLDDHYEDRFYSHWSFFKVTHSLYINWLAEEAEISPEELNNLMHFSIFTYDYIVDIVATREPEIEFIERLDKESL